MKFSVKTLTRVMEMVLKKKTKASPSQFLSRVQRRNRRFWEWFGIIPKMNCWTLRDVDAQPATKRLILSTATIFFDPLGLIAPIIPPFKIMFQKLCKAGRDWDELLDTYLHRQWQTILMNLRQAGRVSFNRCYAEALNGYKVKSVQLHCFADASERYYGAAVYMRVEYESKVECQMISSKTRVAPLAKQTIPRLELLSNLAASTLLKSVSLCLTEQIV